MIFATILLSLATFARPALALDYSLDKSHSRVGFTVRHMMIQKVSGSFGEFDGEFSFDPEKGVTKAGDFVVQAKSIDTDNAKRDDHLRSPDFFDVAKFPTLKVTKSAIKRISKDKLTWNGDLTIRDKTKPVVFEVEHTGMIKDPQGKTRAGFTAKTKINRKDFGLTWNKALETGGVVVSDEVDVILEIQGIEKAAAEKK